MTQDRPELIYDFYGFPKALYEVSYPAKGDSHIAQKVLDRLQGIGRPDETWGIDHGTWSVLKHLYPDADIPVLQLSIDRTQPPEIHYQIGERLKGLREEGVLILGSGNIVHSFRRASFDMAKGHPWAYEFDDYIYQCITQGNHDGVLHHQQAGPCAGKAYETPDHYYPLLYALGASNPHDRITSFNRACVFGGFSMTGYVFG